MLCAVKHFDITLFPVVYSQEFLAISDAQIVPNNKHKENQTVYTILGMYYVQWQLEYCCPTETEYTFFFCPCIGDNDRAARVLFVQHPREHGE